ncbi:MAG: PAS domain S-box protein [Elusimicrobia bacterium]|nr:PAS domain S-box protein [Elusimicrobiota bacterium]
MMRETPSFRMKCLLSFFSMAVLVGLVGLSGIVSARRIQSTLLLFMDQSAPRMHALLELRAATLELAEASQSFGVFGSGSSQAEGTPLADDKYELLAYMEKLDKWAREYERLSPSRMRAGLLEFTRAKDLMTQQSLLLIEMKERRAGRTRIKAQRNAMMAAKDNLKDIIAGAADADAQAQEERRAETLSIVRTMLRLGIGITLAALAVSLVMALYLSRLVIRPIAQLLVAIKQTGHGDLSRRVAVTSTDELGQLSREFNAMNADLSRTTISKDFFNDILESMQDPLFVTDAQGLITLANPSLAALSGYGKEELIGRAASMLFEEKVGLFSGASLGGLKGRDSLQNISTHFIGKSGEKTPILFTASVLRSKDGQTAGYIGGAKDVSGIKKLEARMQQSEKLSALGQLAAGVAHEINNPLGVILGFSQGMSRQVKPGDALELPVKSIEREALRCKNLVQNLLTFSRTSRSDRGIIDLNETVEQAMALIQIQVKMTQDRLRVDLAKDLPKILGNKNQLQQVVLNLAKNAVDAMPNGGTLSIATELLEDKPHSWICLKVADTGTGIPAALLTKIFEPFFTTKPAGQGTSLGLSLISEIVQKHSGTIDVDSRPGGTVFTVKLPVKTGREMEERVKSIELEKLATTSVVPYDER